MKTREVVRRHLHEIVRPGGRGSARPGNCVGTRCLPGDGGSGGGRNNGSGRELCPAGSVNLRADIHLKGD